MDINQLRRWAIENNVEERTLNGFWKAFENCVLDCPDEIERDFGDLDRKLFDLRLNRVCLVIDWVNEDRAYISSIIPIIYKGKEMGYYELMFKITGETFDDYLVTDGVAHI